MRVRMRKRKRKRKQQNSTRGSKNQKILLGRFTTLGSGEDMVNIVQYTINIRYYTTICINTYVYSLIKGGWMEWQRVREGKGRKVEKVQ